MEFDYSEAEYVTTETINEIVINELYGDLNINLSLLKKSKIEFERLISDYESLKQYDDKYNQDELLKIMKSDKEFEINILKIRIEKIEDIIEDLKKTIIIKTLNLG